jgi:hypothetical protein
MNRIAKHTRKQKIRGEETPSWKLAMALGTSTSQPWVKPESSLRSTNPFVRDQSHHILAFEISKLTLYRKITSLIQYLFLFEQVFSAFLIQSNHKTNSAIQKTYRTVNKTSSASLCNATLGPSDSYGKTSSEEIVQPTIGSGSASCANRFTVVIFWI